MTALLSPAGFPFPVKGRRPTTCLVFFARSPGPRAWFVAGWRRWLRASVHCLLGCFLLLSFGQRAVAYDPAVVKVMNIAEIFGTYAFEGDADVNVSGQWIAASRKGVFLSSAGNPQVWQQVFTATGDPMVIDGTTDKILCRINNSGGWAMINRAGIYRSTATDNTVGELITPASSPCDRGCDLRGSRWEPRGWGLLVRRRGFGGGGWRWKGRRSG